MSGFLLFGNFSSAEFEIHKIYEIYQGILFSKDTKNNSHG